MDVRRAFAGLTAAAMLVAVTACSPQVKEVTPQACIDALDHSTEVVGLVSEVIAANTDYVDASRSLDPAIKLKGYEASGKRVDDLRPKIDAALDAWVVAGDECKAKRQ